MINQIWNSRVTARLCRSYRRILIGQFKKDQALEMYALFVKYYKTLSTQRIVLTKKVLNKHLQQTLLPGIALYDTFLHHGFSQKEALASMEHFYNSLYQNTAFVYRLFGHTPFFFSFLQRMTTRSMNRTYPKEGWTTVWIENSRRQIAFDVTSCFYQDILTVYHHTELLPCFCQIDDDVYEQMSPSVKWNRSTTLGRCGSRCDFRFIKQ